MMGLTSAEKLAVVPEQGSLFFVTSDLLQATRNITAMMKRIIIMKERGIGFFYNETKSMLNSLE